MSQGKVGALHTEQQPGGVERWLLSVCLALICLFSVACGQEEGGKESEAGGGNAAGLVSTREDIERATVRIEAEGSFVSAETGQQTSENWGGSGFIIAPSGIAVTNNHVVTGSALLRVYVDGEDEPRNARVLGVSECSDLA